MGVRCSGIEEGGGGVGEVTFGHEVVCLEDARNIGAVNANCDSHQHVLWTLSDASIDAKEVGTFKSFKTEAEERQQRKNSARTFVTHKL